MGEIKIRNVSEVVIYKIDELAKKKKISREEYLRRELLQLVTLPSLEEMESKYENLVSVLAERLEQNNEILDVTNMLMEKILEVLDSEKSHG